MAQCERTVSRHSRPIRHALASTSLGPLKYLERSLSISLSLSLSFSMYAPYRVSTSYLYCMCRICTIRSPPISLCGWEKRLIALNNAEAFRFFFSLGIRGRWWNAAQFITATKIPILRRADGCLSFLPMPDSMHTTTVSIISRWKFWNLLMLQWNQDGPSL